MLLIAICTASLSSAAAEKSKLERSFWLHASLGLFTQKGYFGTDFPATAPPAREEIQNAANLLTGTYSANRLYLIYHHEMPLDDARKVFIQWREACGNEVELVPALVLNMYDKEKTSVFNTNELRELAKFFRENINPENLAIFDILPARNAGENQLLLASAYPSGLIRLGQQPDEVIAPPFKAAVQDTWSGFCHGTRNEEDWNQPGFGAGTLRKWVEARNVGSSRVTWNLVVVAWDYSHSVRGAYPGYDDAEKNMPLPAERNELGAKLIRASANPISFGGFSSDLYILHENSRSEKHDGKAGSFYQILKSGRPYHGHYAGPLNEIAAIYRRMANSGD